MHAICSVDAPNAFGASTEFVRVVKNNRLWIQKKRLTNFSQPLLVIKDFY